MTKQKEQKSKEPRKCWICKRTEADLDKEYFALVLVRKKDPDGKWVDIQDEYFQGSVCPACRWLFYHLLSREMDDSWFKDAVANEIIHPYLTDSVECQTSLKAKLR